MSKFVYGTVVVVDVGLYNHMIFVLHLLMCFSAQ